MGVEVLIIQTEQGWNICLEGAPDLVHTGRLEPAIDEDLGDYGEEPVDVDAA